jgi:metal-responsive CopG/Arc/MetJ family transcriptional regulator
MKVIQITIDDALLAELDADPEVRRSGRSAVIRRMASDYLKRRQSRTISQAYEAGYAESASAELEGWAEETAWPTD